MKILELERIYDWNHFVGQAAKMSQHCQLGDNGSTNLTTRVGNKKHLEQGNLIIARCNIEDHVETIPINRHSHWYHWLRFGSYRLRNGSECQKINKHYNDVIMSTMASQITSLTVIER